MAEPILFYFDFVSPYSYVGSVVIERVAAKRGRAVDWRPTLIGVSILKVMGMQPLPTIPLKGPYLKRDLDRLVAYFDVPFRPHGLTGVNSLAAERAFLWLKDRDPALATEFARRIYRRLWVEGHDITPPDATLDEAEGLGIDRSALEAALQTEEVKEALAAAVDEAIAAGVFGVPTFVVDGETIWGSDRMWMVEHWLDHHDWAVR